MNRQRLGAVLGWSRVAYGVSLMTVPALAQKVGLGLDASANPQSTYLARVLGSRELFVGVMGTGLLGRPAADLMNRSGVAIDAADTVAAVIARRQGRITTPAAAALVVAGLGAVAAGVYVSKPES